MIRAWVRIAVSRVIGLLSPSQARRAREEAFDEEIRSHIALLIEENLRRGMSPERARREAQIAFGNIMVLHEAQRERRTLPAVESVVRDIRYALRICRRNRAFTAGVVLTLALGIGINTTVFTTLNAVAFRPIPARDAARLGRLERWFASGSHGNIQYFFSYPEFRYISDHSDMFADVVGASWIVPVPSGPGDAIRVQLVSPNYFATLGAEPSTGRTFRADEAASLSTPVAVISDAFWRRRFAANPATIGSTILVRNTRFTIVGVAPAWFIGSGNPPQVPDVWLPATLQPLIDGQSWLDSPGERRFQLLGHLSVGSTMAQGNARAGALTSAFADAFPAADRTTALTFEPATFFGETNDPRFRMLAVAVMASVSLVLAIACANLANVLLARAGARRTEIAMRLALGASRGRIVRQLLTESVLLGVFGGGAGLLLSLWGTRVLWIRFADTLQMFLASEATLSIELSPDMRVFAYTVAVSIATGVVFGLVPALRASRDGLGSAGLLASSSRVRGVLVAAQVTVATALLLTSALLLRGLSASETIAVGYDAAHILEVQFERASDPRVAAAEQARVFERLATVQGIAGVALADRLPFAGTWTPPIEINGAHGARDAETISARTLANRVSAEYFSTMGVPTVRGRGFTGEEARNDAPVAIVSTAAAQSLWRGRDPIGSSFTLDLDFRGTLRTFEVIGMAADVRTANVSRIDPSYVYLPIGRGGYDHIIVRSSAEGAAAERSIHDALTSLDPSIAASVQIASLASGPMRLQKLIPTALGEIATTLALVALALAITGIYGVLTYVAGQRRHEIGIRMALGGSRRNVLSLVLLDGLSPVGAGALLGVGIACALSALLQSMLAFPGNPDLLFGVSAFDPVTFASVTLGVAAIALLASAGPAWRAVRVDPLVTLRHE